MITATKAYNDLYIKYKDKIDDLEQLGKRQNTGFSIINRIVNMFGDEIGGNWDSRKEMKDWDFIFIGVLGIVKQHIKEDVKF